MKKEVGQVARVVGVGYQDFGKIRENNCFYIDKSRFIKEWWDQADQVTLITRPRRFGKTLNMGMTEKFFSVNYAGRGNVMLEPRRMGDEGIILEFKVQDKEEGKD